MDIVNRLRYFMEASKLTISQFADTCGIPRPTMSQLMNGRNKRISDEVISKIHTSYPELNVLWLMFGEGTMEANSNTRFSEPQNGTSEPFSVRETTENQMFPDQTNGISAFTGNRAENLATPNSLFEAAQTSVGSRPYPMLDTADLADGTSPHPGAPQSPRVTPPAENILFDDTPSNFAEAAKPASQPMVGQSQTANPGTSFRNTAQDITRTLGVNPAASGTDPALNPTSAIATDSNGSISISPDVHKKITNIVVFYSDNSFQSFLPDV